MKNKIFLLAISMLFASTGAALYGSFAPSAPPYEDLINNHAPSAPSYSELKLSIIEPNGKHDDQTFHSNNVDEVCLAYGSLQSLASSLGDSNNEAYFNQLVQQQAIKLWKNATDGKNVKVKFTKRSAQESVLEIYHNELLVSSTIFNCYPPTSTAKNSTSTSSYTPTLVGIGVLGATAALFYWGYNKIFSTEK